MLPSRHRDPIVCASVGPSDLGRTKVPNTPSTFLSYKNIKSCFKHVTKFSFCFYCDAVSSHQYRLEPKNDAYKIIENFICWFLLFIFFPLQIEYLGYFEYKMRILSHNSLDHSKSSFLKIHTIFSGRSCE